jgi:hypothetical protein
LFTQYQHRSRREKLFDGRWTPLDREAKVRIAHLARALSHPTEKGKHYGVLTAKFVAVLEALLFGFHNGTTGRCFPSYETIAKRAHCARSTVAEAIQALERAGILSWVNRIVRVREWGSDLFGRAQNRWRVLRTSNGYSFRDPKASKSELPPFPQVSGLDFAPIRPRRIANALAPLRDEVSDDVLKRRDEAFAVERGVGGQAVGGAQRPDETEFIDLDLQQDPPALVPRLPAPPAGRAGRAAAALAGAIGEGLGRAVKHGAVTLSRWRHAAVLQAPEQNRELDRCGA